MTDSTISTLLTMDESVFYHLLEGSGTVQIDVIRLGRYFAPFVTSFAGPETPRVRHGAIVRGKSDLLAAETLDGLLAVLKEIAGGAPGLQVNLPAVSNPPLENLEETEETS